MNEQARRMMMDLADTIKGEINRMCVTNDLCELDTMAFHAINNIKKLQDMRFTDFRAKSEGEEKQNESDISDWFSKWLWRCGR